MEVGRAGETVLPRVSRRSERRGLLSSSCPMKMDAHPGLAPGSSVLQTDGSTTLPCARLRMGRPTGAAPAQRSSQDRMLAVTSRPPFESDPPAGAAPAWSPLREECIADLCHGGIENGAPARTCTSILRLRRAACMNLLHLGSEYPRQESHLRREFRKLAFFLLNYGDEKKWCAMPVLPRRPRFGRPPCLLLHQ